MRLYELMERDAEGRLPTVEINMSLPKTIIRTGVYGVLTLLLAFLVGGMPIALITALIFLHCLTSVIFGRRFIISEDGLSFRSVFGHRSVPWSQIDYFSLVGHRDRSLSFLLCFCTADVPYRSRLVWIGNGWQTRAQTLWPYLKWYHAKMCGEENDPEARDDVARMHLMADYGMRRAYMIMTGLIAGTGVFAFSLVMLLRAVRGH